MSADQLHYVVYDGHLSTRFKLKLSHTTFWAVLARESAAGPKRISFYNTQAEFVTGLQPQFFLELRSILRVQQVETKGKTQRPYQFKIISTSSTQLCATKTAEECQKWVKSMTELMQGIPEPNVVYEFQIFVQPGGHADKLNLSGSYILKVFDSFLQLYSASGAFPTDFHCSLANATVFCTATNILESEAGMLMIQTSSNADIGKGELAFSAKSAIDFTRAFEHRKKCTSQNEATTLRKQRFLSLSEVTRPSLSCSRNIHLDPKPLADVSQLRCQPSPMKKLPRQSVPVFPGHALDSIQAPGSDKISMQPKRSQQPSSTTLPHNWKPIPPPKPWFRSASPNPPWGRPLSLHPDIELSGSQSNDQISTNKTTSTTSKDHSHFIKVLLPVPHCQITHATKCDVEDPTNSSLPSAASPKKVARLPPKEQAKAKKCSDSESKSANEGSRTEAAQKRFMYFNKSAGDSGDYVINDIGIGNDKSSCLDLMVKKNTAYGVVEMGLGDKSSPVVEQVKVDEQSNSEPKSAKEGSRNEAPPKSFMYLDKSVEDSGDYEVSDIEMGIDKSSCIDLMVEKNTAYGVVELELGDKSSLVVTALGSSGYEYVDTGIGNGPIVRKNTTGGPGGYAYVDVGVEKPPTTVGESSAGESGDYEYVKMGIGSENPPSIVEKSTAGESGVYEYVDVGFDKPPSTGKSNVVGKLTVDLQALRQKQALGGKHPALVGLQANGPPKTRDTATSNNFPEEEGMYVIENLKEDQSVGDTASELPKKVHHKKQGSPHRPPLPPRPPPPASRPKQITTSNNFPEEEGMYVIENLKEDQSVGDTASELPKKVHHKKQGSPHRPPLPPRPPPPASRPKQISK